MKIGDVYYEKHTVVGISKRTSTISETDTEIVKVLPTDVLDKIRTELHATAEMHEDKNYYLREEWIDEIIDKYKAESEDRQ